MQLSRVAHTRFLASLAILNAVPLDTPALTHVEADDAGTPREAQDTAVGGGRRVSGGGRGTLRGRGRPTGGGLGGRGVPVVGEVERESEQGGAAHSMWSASLSPFPRLDAPAITDTHTSALLESALDESGARRSGSMQRGGGMVGRGGGVGQGGVHVGSGKATRRGSGTAGRDIVFPVSPLFLAFGH